MRITQLEYREKSTLNTWRRITFPVKANLVSEEAALPSTLLDMLGSLAAFACNRPNNFTNGISRMTFRVAHEEYMWFAKTGIEDGVSFIDEEELYNQDNVMLMRRAEEHMAINEQTVDPIPVNETMLIQHPELEVLQKLQKAFGAVQYHVLRDDTCAGIVEQIAALPHGALVLLDATALSTPLDVSALADREDIQLLTAGCTGLPAFTITKKGRMISCQ